MRRRNVDREYSSYKRHLSPLAISGIANRQCSLALSSGGGGNRTASSSSDLDDSRTVSRTGIDENTSKEHEQNALPDILMTMSQIPDVNRELASGKVAQPLEQFAVSFARRHQAHGKAQGLANSKALLSLLPIAIANLADGASPPFRSRRCSSSHPHSGARSC
jgi:hypothetical protein